MGLSPRCYIPSFVEISLGPEKKIFQGFLPYMGMLATLDMWPASCHQIFISLYLKAFIQNLVQISTVVSEKIWFEFLYVHNLGPRSRNDLDLQYSHIFIYSIRCLLLLPFRSLAAIVSEKSTVFTLPIEKPKLTNLTLPLNRSRSLEGHHLNKLWCAGVPDATYQVSSKSARRFRRRRFLKGFYHIWAWRPSWSCDQHHVIRFSFPCTWKLS